MYAVVITTRGSDASFVPASRNEKPASTFRRSRKFRLQAREVGAKVRALRQERGMTLEEASARMDGDFRHFQRIETGEVNVTLASVLRVAEALRVPPYRLLQTPEEVRTSTESTLRPSTTVTPSHTSQDNIKYGVQQGAGTPRSDAQFLANLGATVRRLRGAKGLTQRALAQAIGMTVPHLQRIEYGKQNVTVLTLVRIARALGVEASGLLVSDD